MNMFIVNAFVLIIFIFLNVAYIEADEIDKTSTSDLDGEKSNTADVITEDSQSDDEESDTKDEDNDQEAVKKRNIELRNKKKLKYYFSVSIQKRGAHYASGAVVHKKWILSVAELFYNVRESINLYSARLGSFNCKKGGVVVPLKGIEIHPKYKYRLPNFDLALLRIPKIDTDLAKYVFPIKLATFGDDQILKDKFWSTYWPRLIVKGNVLPLSATERYKHNTMRVSPQEVISYGDCKGLLTSTTLHNSSMCFEPIPSYHSRCTPDAGAPIVTQKYLWAIISGWTSPDCLESPSPTIATKVSSKFVRPWLKLVLNITSSLEED